MSEPTPATEENTSPEIYDPAGQKRFEYDVVRAGVKYAIAFVFGEVTDERYVKWLREFNVSGNQDDVHEESREASARLWDDVIVRVDGVEYEPDLEWKQYIPDAEKIQGINDLLTVAISEEETVSKTKLRLEPGEVHTIIKTEAWGSDGKLLTQTHELRPRTFELEKKYARIQAKRFKQENVKGLRKKAKIEYVPQDEKLGQLYDEMQVSISGFVEGSVPLRFKTAVIHHVFGQTLESRDLGK